MKAVMTDWTCNSNFWGATNWKKGICVHNYDEH